MTDGPDRIEYQHQYREGLDLFQKALTQYNQTNNVYKKAEFEDVMGQAFQVLQDTASGLAREELRKQNEKIGKDFADLQDGKSGAAKRLQQDLNSAKKTI